MKSRQMVFRRHIRSLTFSALVLSVVAAFGFDHPTPGVGGTNARYATDAYPGFDDEKEMVNPERKEPRWFSFINGPDRANAAEQYAWCEELIATENFSRAAKQLDALVREWPSAPEAAPAQLKYAELLSERLDDHEEAFAAYRYLLDFYSLNCDYGAIADRLYQLAGVLKAEGKEVMFVRFANTVDVRRAYETCVLRAPGASWVPDAMLTIGALREDEDKADEAIKVYENLRNLHPGTEQAKTALLREARVRLAVLHEREYNRSRTQDTLAYLKQALLTCRPEDAPEIRSFFDEVLGLLEREAYLSAKFYDSTTRKSDSAVNAYERYLAEYPEGAHAETVRARLAELRAKAEARQMSQEGAH